MLLRLLLMGLFVGLLLCVHTFLYRLLDCKSRISSEERGDLCVYLFVTTGLRAVFDEFNSRLMLLKPVFSLSFS